MRQKQTGFTVVEVMIVLAIAAVILMIVLLAVPALNRAKRNAERTHDAAYIVSEREEYDVNVGTVLQVGYTDCSPPNIPSQPFCQYLQNHMSYYDLSNVQFNDNGRTPPAVVPVVTDPEIIRTDTYLKCNQAGTGAQIASTPYSMVVLYAVEATSGSQPRCLESEVTPTCPGC